MKITDTLDQKFQVLRSRASAFEKEAKEKGYAETPWGRRMYKDATSGFWALLAQATAADYFKYILDKVAEKLPELIISAPLFDGCLYVGDIAGFIRIHNHKKPCKYLDKKSMVF